MNAMMLQQIIQLFWPESIIPRPGLPKDEAPQSKTTKPKKGKEK